MDDDMELDRLLENVLGPPPETSPPGVKARALDDILGSRTHVRVLRELVVAEDTNLTVREIARRAMTSHARVLAVLRQLTSVGFVTHQRTLTHAVHQLREDHPLASPMRSLFDGEIRAAEP
jgi:hypothetical protein